MSSTEHIDYEHVLDEAALWVSRMQDSDVSANQENEFNSWLNQSELHQQAYSEMLATWSQTGLAADIHGFRAEAEYLSKRRPTSNRISKKLILSVAASIFVVFSLSIQLFKQQSAEPVPSKAITYRTDVGEFREVKLPDGSNILLNTQSRVDVSFEADQRSLRLLKGEAYFEVAHDPHRPFIVNIGDSSVRAVGTAFNIYRQSKKTVVTITEGIVSIKSNEEGQAIEVDALHRVSIDRQAVSSVHNANLDIELAWQDHQLVFRDSPLKHVLSELNRYLPKPVSLKHSSLPEKNVSGTFDVRDPEEVLNALIESFDLSVHLDNNTRILKRS